MFLFYGRGAGYSCVMSSLRSGRGRQSFMVSSGVLEISWHGSHATVFLDGVESSHIDVDRPQNLEFEYMQHMDVVCSVLFGESAPLKVLHVGGAANALPWAWSITHPGSRQTVVEIDELLISTVREVFDLPRSPELKIRCDDGRRVLDSLRPGTWDVVVRDAFTDGVVPQHLMTVESAQAAGRALRSSGVYLVNAAHGGGADARVEVEALMSAFECVFAIVDPKVAKSGRRGNVVFVGALGLPMLVEDFVRECDRGLRRLPFPARILVGEDLRRWQAGSAPVRDVQVGWPPA